MGPHRGRPDSTAAAACLPMAVFLTKNAPGLRTSPVKRGYWVVRRVLGERIPPPPPTVPELPKDEAKLGELTLAASARPPPRRQGLRRLPQPLRLGRPGLRGLRPDRRAPRRKTSAASRSQTAATFPDGKERTGLDGLRDYLRDKRQDDFLDNLCRKLFSYALGRGLLLSDRPGSSTAMKAKLKADGYAFGSLVESIVTSPQFRNRRRRGGEGK